MLDIKLTRQNGKSLSLSLPCALTDLITGDAPFYISCGLAGTVFTLNTVPAICIPYFWSCAEVSSVNPSIRLTAPQTAG